MPPGAVGVLLVVLLIVNPFTRYAAARLVFSQVMAGVALLCAGLAAFRWQQLISGIAVEGVAIWTPAVIAALIVICLLMGRRPLSRNETLVIYISCLISCLVPGHGAENFFIPCLMGPFYFATPENAWLTKFLEPYTPQWLTPALWADAGTAFWAKWQTTRHRLVFRQRRKHSLAILDCAALGLVFFNRGDLRYAGLSRRHFAGTVGRT